MSSLQSGKPRLLVLTSTYPRYVGDAEPGFVHELARRLTDRFEVAVLCPHSSGAKVSELMDGVQVWRYRYAPAFAETLVNDGGIVANLKRSRWKWLLVPGFLLGALWSCWRMLYVWRPSVVHAHWLLPQGLIMAGLSAVRLTSVPYLVTSHGADLFALRAPLLQKLKKIVVDRASAMTVVSEPMVQEATRFGADASKIFVYPMGVDLHSRFATTLTNDKNRGGLLFVGRMVEKKGLLYLVEAMPQILAECPDVTLTIVGFGPEEKRLRALADELGLGRCVHFHGAATQQELPEIYRAAKVFVAPFVQAPSGDEEGLGLVAIEAGGCGCRLVLGDVPAVRKSFSGLPGVDFVVSSHREQLAEVCIRALNASGVGGELATALKERFDWVTKSADYDYLLHQIESKALTSALSDGAEK